ncbi:MAG: hypothetical protein ACRECZ_08485, partial [Methylocella sp.]
GAFDGACDPALLQDPAEKHLWEKIQSVSADTKLHLSYAEASIGHPEFAVQTRLEDGMEYDAAWRALTGQKPFEDAMECLSSLRPPVDVFFEHVTVNAEDPKLRLNRLRLLNELRSAMHTAADFSKIAG